MPEPSVAATKSQKNGRKPSTWAISWTITASRLPPISSASMSAVSKFITPLVATITLLVDGATPV